MFTLSWALQDTMTGLVLSEEVTSMWPGAAFYSELLGSVHERNFHLMSKKSGMNFQFD